MSTYSGKRTGEVTTVTVDGKPLDPRNDLRNLSEAGFEWGYIGSGPYQLALAMLADHFEDEAMALGNYRSFCEMVVLRFAEDGWTMETDRIQASLDGVIEVDMTLEQLLRKAKGLPID